MARIAFVQNLAYEYLGTTLLATLLRQAGHLAEVFILERTEDDLLRQIMSFKPDMAAFSVTTGIHEWALGFATRLKAAHKVRCVFGGPHPTFFPEVILHESVDIICRGEGEHAVVELAEKFDAKKPLHDIASLWVKVGGQVVRNPLRHLIHDLDSLPNPDRSVYRSKYPYLAKSTGTFMAGRGCPYRCSFCFNHAAQRMYKGLGSWVRFRSTQRVVEEIVDSCRKHSLRTVYMQDDTLLLSK
jgi:anaerobic magnesium-protoporphyrin IX monomethyl ester cyclase